MAALLPENFESIFLFYCFGLFSEFYIIIILREKILFDFFGLFPEFYIRLSLLNKVSQSMTILQEGIAERKCFIYVDNNRICTVPMVHRVAYE